MSLPSLQRVHTIAAMEATTRPALRALGAHEREVRVRVAIVGDESKLRLDVGDAPVFKVFRDDEAEQRTAEGVMVQSDGRCIDKCCREMTLCDFGCGHHGLPFVFVLCELRDALDLRQIKAES